MIGNYSLEQFLTRIEQNPNWTDQIGTMLQQMPSLDDMLVELAYLATPERDEIRIRLAEFQQKLGHYLTQSRSELASQAKKIDNIRQSQHAAESYAHAHRHWHDLERLHSTKIKGE